MNIAVILAAGEGTRMKSKTPKVLHKICGREIIKYVLDTIREAEIDKSVLILGHGKEKISSAVEEYGAVIREQPIGKEFPYGTGYAVMQAVNDIDDNSNVIILSGDVPFISSETIRKFMEFHSSGGYAASVITSVVPEPKGYGRIVRSPEGLLEAIVEEKDSDEIQKNINEINSGIYCIKGKLLKESLNYLDTNNSQNEYYITDVIKVLNNQGEKSGCYTVENINEIAGINDKVQLSEMNRYMTMEINRFHMLNGVTIINPEHTYIEKGVKIEKDVIIYPGTIIEGESFIGEDSCIGPDTRIISSSVGKKTSVEKSKLLNSVVGDNCSIGPYAYLRPGTVLKNNIKIGDFVEVKNSVIDDGSKASHLAYVGDSDIGKNVNIGCGVIFVNYDGRKKHRSVVKDDVFIGSNSNIVSPVTLEKASYVACGSTITEDVKEKNLAIARARQINKEEKGKDRY